MTVELGLPQVPHPSLSLSNDCPGGEKWRHGVRNRGRITRIFDTVAQKLNDFSLIYLFLRDVNGVDGEIRFESVRFDLASTVAGRQMAKCRLEIPCFSG